MNKVFNIKHWFRKNEGFTLHLLGRKKEGVFPKLFKKGEGFTLGELLVVVAIISLLSSIVLVSFKNAREKARIAVMLQFSSSLHHAVGANLIGEWKFEDSPQSTNVADTSGSGNNGTWQGSGTHWAANDIPQLGTAGQFSSGNGVTIPGNTLDGMDKLTVQLWFKPTALTPTITYVLLDKQYSYQILCDMNEGKVIFIICPGNIPSPPIACYGESIFFPFQLGKWYHFAGTYYGGTSTEHPRKRIFLNGTIIEDMSFAAFSGPAPIRESAQPLALGERLDGLGLFIGLIDDVRIYEDELTPAQIKKLYAEGAKKRGLLVKE